MYYTQLPDQTQQLEEVDYGYHRSSYTEIETFGYCPACNKRIVTGDDLFVSSFDIFCSEKCITKFEEDEKNG